MLLPVEGTLIKQTEKIDVYSVISSFLTFYLVTHLLSNTELSGYYMLPTWLDFLL